MDKIPSASVTISNIDKATWRRMENALFPVSEEDKEVRLVFTRIVDLDTLLKVEGDFGDMANIEMKEGQTVELSATPKTRRGNVGAIEPGTANWTSTDESVVRVIESSDTELKAKIHSEGVGVATVYVKADGKQGEGEREIVGTATVVVGLGDALTFELAGTAPVDEEVPAEPPVEEPPVEEPPVEEPPAEEPPVEEPPVEEPPTEEPPVEEPPVEEPPVEEPPVEEPPVEEPPVEEPTEEPPVEEEPVVEEPVEDGEAPRPGE